MSDRASLDLLTTRKRQAPRGARAPTWELARAVPRVRLAFRRLGPLGLAHLILAAAMASCTTQNDNTYDAGEANTRILSMFALRDLECGTTHQLNGILFNRADRNNVDTCVNALFLLDCTAWQAADPSPAVCRAIGVSFR